MWKRKQYSQYKNVSFSFNNGLDSNILKHNWSGSCFILYIPRSEMNMFQPASKLFLYETSGNSAAILMHISDTSTYVHKRTSSCLRKVLLWKPSRDSSFVHFSGVTLSMAHFHRGNGHRSCGCVCFKATGTDFVEQHVLTLGEDYTHLDQAVWFLSIRSIAADIHGC
jgi:hypothetical protein